MKQEIIAQGAEAVIYKNGNFIIKNRISKGYRHPELDRKIIKSRTKSEAKILTKASGIINCPKPFFVPGLDFSNIKMPFIEGKKLSEHLDNLKNKFEIMEKVGEETAKLHDADIIHGDLTTSNMILRENKIYIIDFGLGFQNGRIEDKAVDLHLIKQALEAKHFKYHSELFSSFLKGYKKSKESDKVLEQLKKVEARGRYRKKAQE
jgi:TP53 regulating kinase-like protein